MIIRLLLSFVIRSVTFVDFLQSIFFFPFLFYPPPHFFYRFESVFDSWTSPCSLLGKIPEKFAITFFLELEKVTTQGYPPGIVLKKELELNLSSLYQTGSLFSFFSHCIFGQLNVLLGFLSKDSLLILGSWPHFWLQSC